jgi:hypothetical protein
MGPYGIIYLISILFMAMRRIFWDFCINRFGIGPLHYVSSHSDFGFEFAEIFVTEKRLAESASRGVADLPSRRVVFRLRISP